MLVLIGASASGKTEVAKILIKTFGYTKIITNTTRTIRPGETDGVDYHFHTKKQFLSLKEKEYFIETATYDGHLYGTAFKDVGLKTVLIVEPNGANSILKANLDNTVVIFFDASEETRTKRMKARGDHKDKIIDRIKGDRAIFDTQKLTRIDHIVTTDIKNQHEIAEDIHILYMEAVSHD